MRRGVVIAEEMHRHPEMKVFAHIEDPPGFAAQFADCDLDTIEVERLGMRQVGDESGEFGIKRSCSHRRASS